MSKLVQIYNLTSDDIDVAYINIEQISSIEAMDNENTYMIIMNNNTIYRTDRDGFESIRDEFLSKED